MVNNKVSWKIGGEAGYGIMESGTIFAKAFSRGGYHVFCYAEYPSLIRGGHNTFNVRIEDEPIYAQVKPVDLLVALNQNTILHNAQEVMNGGGIIYDLEGVDVKPFNNITLYGVPIKKIVRDNNGDPIMRNIVALGASTAVLGYPTDAFKKIVQEEFGKKGQAIVDENIKLFMAGHDYITKNYPTPFKNQMKVLGTIKKRMIIDGNQAIAFGAIKAGCKFMSSYPMTPATSIMLEMVANEHKHHLVVKQTEDEIAAINEAIGASFGGVRAMAATSGGGFSLMVEALGMSGITETPVVVALSSRGGPSTGLPTWTEQSDLRFAIHASHGEFPRLVIAPGDITECFYETIRAFNLAYKYQVPAIIMTDKYLGSSPMTVDLFDQKNIKIPKRDYLTDQEVANMPKYKRFQLTESGISPRAIPGQKNALFMVTSDEHNEEGIFNEEIENRNNQMNKRFNKLKGLIQEMPVPVLHGPKDAPFTIISWGSTKGPVIEAMKFLKKEGIEVNYVQIISLYPFHTEQFASMASRFKKALVLENNYTGQLAGIIREQTGLQFPVFLKFDGRPFNPEEIVDKVKSMR